MALERRRVERSDILPLADYVKVRKLRKQALLSLKQRRRVDVGPVATLYFECFEMVLHQIQEMLYIEKGGEEQLLGELEAYNPLIPDGRELVATVMLEIDNPERRRRILAGLGGIEGSMMLTVSGAEIVGVPEKDQDRTTADGKASSVQFVHFPFTDHQVALFCAPGAAVTVGFRHPAYAHSAVLSEATRCALAADFRAPC